MKEITNQKQNKRFLLFLGLLSLAIFFVDYEEQVLPYNSTVLAFSYQYGFISRGLAGTIYQLLDQCLPFHMMQYEAVLYYTLGITALFFVLFFVFVGYSLKKCEAKYVKEMQYLIVLLCVFTVSMFSYKRNFGRLDIYLMAVTLIGILCIMGEKMEWLVILLSGLGIMFHQGYAFMYFNVLLVLLIYKGITIERKKIYYFLIALVSFLVVAGLFLWFEFFSHSNGTFYVDEIIKNATSMTQEFRGMEYHDTLIKHEILGEDVSSYEYPYRIMNFVELPIFLLIISPYIVIIGRLFYRVVKKQKEQKEKLKYIVLAIGSGTMVPLFLMKCDYGRWFFALFVYYLLVIISLYGMGDKELPKELKKICCQMKEKYPFSFWLLLLPALITPFWDVHINELLKGISNPINQWFLHIW